MELISMTVNQLQRKEKNPESHWVLHNCLVSSSKGADPLSARRRDNHGLNQEQQTAVNKAGMEGIFPRKHKEMKSRERHAPMKMSGNVFCATASNG